MRTYRASMEPFWDLKYVEYLTRISSEYFISSVLPSLTSIAGRTSRVCAIYSTHLIMRARVPCHDRSD
jgi:hypothetical protein